MTALLVDAVAGAHGRGRDLRRVLSPTSFALDAGETLAVIGTSGAGKSTLAEIVLALRRPASGSVSVTGEPWASAHLTPSRARRRLVQGVPQDATASFVPRWTLRRCITDAVRRLTDEVDVDHRVERAAAHAGLERSLLDRRPAQLSGGQAQRAAIARALAVGPVVLVADEPTSALDPARTAAVADALVRLARSTNTALLLVTHDPAVAARCDRTLPLTAPAV